MRSEEDTSILKTPPTPATNQETAETLARIYPGNTFSFEKDGEKNLTIADKDGNASSIRL